MASGWPRFWRRPARPRGRSIIIFPTESRTSPWRRQPWHRTAWSSSSTSPSPRGWRGQAPRQPGQVRKEAAVTSPAWVVVAEKSAAAQTAGMRLIHRTGLRRGQPHPTPQIAIASIPAIACQPRNAITRFTPRVKPSPEGGVICHATKETAQVMTHAAIKAISQNLRLSLGIGHTARTGSGTQSRLGKPAQSTVRFRTKSRTLSALISQGFRRASPLSNR